MKPLVKICGITNPEDALSAVKSGTDALGFVFYKKSPRYISINSALRICEQLPKELIKIGVFVNEEVEILDSILKAGFPDYFQFSGDETPDYCLRYANKAIKAFRINDKNDITTIENYAECRMHLFDTGSKGKYGGTGRTFNWNLLTGFKHIRPVILAGGLTAENVSDAVKIVRPYMVDVSSSVEEYPGKKDPDKMVKFINACKNSEQ